MKAWSRCQSDGEPGDQLRIPGAMPGPIDRRRQMEYQAACMGNALRLQAFMNAGASGG